MEPIEPVRTIVTRRENTDKMEVAVTPGDSANLITVPMRMAVRVLIKVARVYVQSLVGFLSAGGLNLDGGILPSDFQSLFISSAGLAVAPAVVAGLMNLTEFLTKLDESHPELRG